MGEPAGRLQRLTLVEATWPSWIIEPVDRWRPGRDGTEGILLHAKAARLLLLGRRLLRWREGLLVLHERMGRPSPVLALGLAHEVERLLARHPRKVSEDLLGGGLQMLQQNRPRVLVERLVAELAGFGCVHAAVSGVKVFAGKTLVEVEALFLLGTAVEEVKLAKFKNLRRLRIMRKDAALRTLERKKILSMPN